MDTKPRNIKIWIAAGLTLYLAACVALKAREQYQTTSEDRGLKFPHAPHVEALDCTNCHDFTSEEPTPMDHEFCGVCHDIPMDNPTEEACSLCHTRDDFTVQPWESVLRAETKFDHAPHVAAEVECSECHKDPDKEILPSGPLKPLCMDCHGQVSAELNECSVCHKELSTDVIPKFRGETRLAHDSPEIWEHVHGREARVDRNFCSQCHVEEEFCVDCHRTEEPDSHTVAFTRRTHGLQATWDRQSCAACHEEDSCLKCHQNTRPASHRGRFGEPANTHCVQCHYPPQDNNCTVCHESIEHRSAGFSPHSLGVYPPDCAKCHPGGLPNRAPHLMNSTVRCIVCHK